MKQNQVVVGYWGLRGRGQVIRTLLAYCEVQFEDKHYDGQIWFGQDKPALLQKGLILANLPYLKDGDFLLAESSAIQRYIPGKYKPELLGKTVEDQALINMYIGASDDLLSQTNALLFNPNFDSVKDQIYNDKVKSFLEKFHQIYDGKEFALGYLTLCDFIYYERLQYVKGIWPEHWSNYPNFDRLITAFEALPQIKAYQSTEGFLKLKDNFLPQSAKWSGPSKK